MIRSLHHIFAAVVASGMLLGLDAGRVPLAAQDAARDASIEPGMSRAQVEERLGPPKVVRAAGATTFLFYANGCLKRCGMDDLVVLEHDEVTDAIFRSPTHRYTGQSSSPLAVEPRASRSAPGRRPDGVGAIRSDSAMSTAGGGGLVIGGAAPPTDSASPRSGRRARMRRARTLASEGATRARSLFPTAAAPAAPPPPAGAAGTTARDGSSGGVNGARTGRRSTTGPVDARAAVKNTGVPLYPAATPVRTPSSGTDSSAARVPFQGAQLAPADSDLRALRRAATPPGQTTPSATRPDSTRP